MFKLCQICSSITGKNTVSHFHTATSPQFANLAGTDTHFGAAGSSHFTVGLILNCMEGNTQESVAILYEESILLYLTSCNFLVEQLPKIFPVSHKFG